MNRLMHRTFSGTTATVVLTSVLFAASSPALAQTSDAKLTEKQAEAIATRLFAIPTRYQLAQNSLSSDGQGRPIYVLSYAYPATSLLNQVNLRQQQINVSIDANTGTVVQYSRTPEETGFQFPVSVSQQQAAVIARQWAKTLYPTELSQTRMQPTGATSVGGSLTQPIFYTFTFERMINGIPAPFDGFSLQIGQNGHLLDANENWSRLGFPAAKDILSKTRLQQIAGAALQLYLGYTNAGQGGANSAHNQLVYQQYSPTSMLQNWNTPYDWQNAFASNAFPVIDALTGKALDGSGNAVAVTAYPRPQPVASGGPTLFPGTVQAHWTKAQALAVAQRVLGLAPGETLRSYNKTTVEPSGDTEYDFAWGKDNPAQANASVDATRGVVTQANNVVLNPIAFKLGMVSPKLTRAVALADAARLLKRIFPQDTGGLAIIPNQFANSPVAPTSFQIEPIIHGLPATGGIGFLQLNPITGDLQYFGLDSQALSGSYPSPQTAISLAQAQRDWLTKYPLQLQYLLTQSPQSWQYEKLGVSHPAQQTAPRIILAYASSAPYGERLDAIAQTWDNSQGPSTPPPYAGVIHDLQGNPAAPQIQLLVLYGLLAADAQGDVHPAKDMTRAAFIKLVVDALGNNGPARGNGTAGILTPQMVVSLADVPSKSPAYPEIVSAYVNGWMPSDGLFQPNAVVTRGFAAGVMVRALGLSGLLTSPKLFPLTATDAAQIPSAQRPADAIAVATGMLPLVQGAFAPSAHVTIADAAVAVVQAAVINSEDHLGGGA